MVVDRGPPLNDALVGHAANFLEACLKWMSDKNVSVQAPAASPTPAQLGEVKPLSANVFRISRVGTEGVLEGFYASPMALLAAGQPNAPVKRVDLEAVCNIPLSLSTLVGVLVKLKEIAG